MFSALLDAVSRVRSISLCRRKGVASKIAIALLCYKVYHGGIVFNKSSFIHAWYLSPVESRHVSTNALVKIECA